MLNLSTCSRRFVSAFCALGLLVASCSSDDADNEVDAASGLERDIGAVRTSTAGLSPSTTALPVASLSDRGPYDVGVMTVDVGEGEAEVWYPAVETKGETEFFDPLAQTDESAGSVPGQLSGTVDTTAHRNARPKFELSAPLVIYNRGPGESRRSATGHTAHLASWGYVVVSSDLLDAAPPGANPELGGQPLGDIDDTVAALRADPSLGPLVDAQSVVVTGHSNGALKAATDAANEIIDGYISISGWAPDVVVQKPALVVAGQFDSVVSPDKSRELFDRLDGEATFVEVGAAAHSSFNDACRVVRDHGGLRALTDVADAQLAERAENGCLPPMVQPEASIAVLNHYTLAFLDSLFDNPAIDAGADLLASDASGAITVDNFDIGASGTVSVELSEFARR
jgi:dienelactone hydrolase